MATPGFKGFLAKLKDSSSVALLSELNQAIEQFNGSTYAADEEQRLVGSPAGGDGGGALGALERRMAASAQWKAQPEALEDGREGLEKYVMTKVYGRAWQASPADASHSEKLDAKIARLASLITPAHLDIPDNFRGRSERWETALAALRDLNKYKAPKDKLVCVLNCCKVVNMHLKEAADRAAAEAGSNVGSISADDFLPVFIFVVLHANVPQLYSNVHYIMNYRAPSRMVGEAAYHLTNLSSVLAFLENCTAGDFCHCRGEGSCARCSSYDAHMGPELGGPLSVDGSNGGGGNGASDASEAAAGAAAEAVAAVVSPHTFIDHDLTDLRVGDVAQLLAEYKKLARAFDALTQF